MLLTVPPRVALSMSQSPGNCHEEGASSWPSTGFSKFDLIYLGYELMRSSSGGSPRRVLPEDDFPPMVVIVLTIAPSTGSRLSNPGSVVTPVQHTT